MYIYRAKSLCLLHFDLTIISTPKEKKKRNLGAHVHGIMCEYVSMSDCGMLYLNKIPKDLWSMEIGARLNQFGCVCAFSFLLNKNNLMSIHCHKVNC